MGSEVAWLRAQIEAELEAMQQGFNGFATTAKHNIMRYFPDNEMLSPQFEENHYQACFE